MLTAVERYKERMAERRAAASRPKGAPVEVEVAPGILRTEEGYVVNEEDFLIAASLAPQTVVANLNLLRTNGEVARLEITNGEYSGKIRLSGNAFETLMGWRRNEGFSVSEGELGDMGAPTRRGEAFISAYDAQKPLMAFQSAQETARKLVKQMPLDDPGEYEKAQIKALLTDPTERHKIEALWSEHVFLTRTECVLVKELRERLNRGKISRTTFEELKKKCGPTMSELEECWRQWSGYEKSLEAERNRRGISGPTMVADGYAALIRSLGI